MDNDPIINRLVGSDSLPRLPAVVVRLIELLGDPDTNPKLIADTLSKDADLTANVLRAVNSSFYGLRQKVSNIQRAVVLLGGKAIRSIVMGCIVCGDYRFRGVAGFDPVFFWRHSLFASVCARIIGLDRKVVDAEEAFLRGLMLNLGAMAMAITLGTKYTQVLGDGRRAMNDIAADERSLFGVDHAAVSAAMIDLWGLPVALSAPLSFAFEPTEAPESLRPAACVVAVASEAADVIIAAQAGGMDHFFAVSNTFSDHAHEWLGMAWKDADDLIQRATAAAGDVAKLLRIDAGKLPDLDKLGEQFEIAVHNRPAA